MVLPDYGGNTLTASARRATQIVLHQGSLVVCVQLRDHPHLVGADCLDGYPSRKSMAPLWVGDRGPDSSGGPTNGGEVADMGGTDDTEVSRRDVGRGRHPLRR